MLKHRILTALVLIPLVIYLILYSSSEIFSLIFTLISLLAIDEWCKIHNFPAKFKTRYLLSISLLMAFLYWLNGSYFLQVIILFISLLFWGLALWQIRQYEKGHTNTANNLPLAQLMVYFKGVLLIVPAWFSLVLLKQQQWSLEPDLMIDGGQLILLLMLMVWCADTGAYFFGRLWGNKKLAPRVSPGKTQMGLVGAFVLSSVLIIIWSYFNALNNGLILELLIMTWIVVFVSIVGDLYESMIKRGLGVKDSGHILPGHGGVLDRIDSLTAASPIFCLMILIWGR